MPKCTTCVTTSVLCTVWLPKCEDLLYGGVLSGYTDI